MPKLIDLQIDTKSKYLKNHSNMRAYHFISEHWGLESVKLRRLKLSLLEDMNDPFELLGVELKAAQDRELFHKLKAEMNKTIGVICFSRNWNNPVLWSHYADKHRGLCLGFDIPDAWAKKVTYTGSRLKSELEFEIPNSDEESLAYKLITTKYSHWSYEDEVRLIINLADGTSEKEKYFLQYGPALCLREVIIGPRSNLTRQDIEEILTGLKQSTSIVRSRLAFHSYKVVRNRLDDGSKQA